jgi:hypothetical protein
MLYFGLYVQLRRGSVAGYTTDESWAYGPKEGVEAFESITFFIRFIYAINFEHLLMITTRIEPPLLTGSFDSVVTADTKANMQIYLRNKIR